MRGVSIMALALAACASGGPVVDAVTPDPIAPQRSTDVTIHGSGFANALRGTVDNRPFSIFDQWTATVAGQPASSVARVDDSTLTATLPPLDEGAWDLTVVRPDGRSATLAGGVHVVGTDLGMPDDLTGADLSVPPDLIGADLTPPPDLGGAPDLLPMCNPPALPSTVGPGPNLGITLSGVKLDGVSNFAHVAAGGQFSVTANYKITDASMTTDQIIFGVAPSDPEVCLFSGVVNGTKLGSATVMMTAPTTPGTYTLRFHYGQDSACNPSGWWTVGGAPTAAEDFAAICVP